MTIQELLALLLSGDLSAVTDEELQIHETTLLDEFDARRAAGVRGADALAELAQIADAVEAIRHEAGTRIEAAEADAQAIADLDARLRPVVEEVVEETPEVVDEIDEIVETEEVPIEEPVLVTAAAVPAAPAPARTRPRPAPMNALPSDAPPAPAARPNQITVLGQPVGANVDRAMIAEAFIEADRRIGMAPYSINHPVISLHGDYPESRRLELRNPAHNDRVISALIGPEAMRTGAMTASALCGPAQPYYGLAMISSARRPMHDEIGSFSVSERGKLSFNRPFAFSDFSGAVGIWEDADNEDENAEKNCVAVTCASPSEAEVKAFTRCLTINNFFARFNPEMVAQAVDLTVVNWARLSEIDLLDQIKASSVQTVSGRALGAVADIVYTLAVAAAGYRSSSRMDEDAPLVSAWPAWVIDACAGDMARASHQYADQLRFTRQALEAAAANLNVRLIFYIDSPSTGTSQVFSTQGVGNLKDFPDFVQWGLWHEGAHVVLDGGPDLNFGITRDAASNRVNTYQSFGESLEGYAFFGLKSLWNTQAFCPSGTFSAPVDVLDDVCGGASTPGS